MTRGDLDPWSSGGPGGRSAGRVVVSVVMTVALVAGSFAIAMTTADFVQSRLGASAVTKAPTGKDLSARKKLTLKAKVMQGPLIPGVKRPLKVSMHNPLSKPLKVTAVTVHGQETEGAPAA